TLCSFNKPTSNIFSFLTIRPQPTSTLFPYTTLFRSGRERAPQPRSLRVASERDKVAPWGRCRCAMPARHTGLSRSHGRVRWLPRSEEHTSELQSRFDLVCRLLLEKKNKQKYLQHATM